jgi:hypothetical protein
MPVQAFTTVCIADDEVSAKKELLARIEKEAFKPSANTDDLEQDLDQDFEALEAASEIERLRSLEEYQKLADQTRTVRLEKLIQVGK